MAMDDRNYLNDLSERVIGAAYEVSNVLGVGFLDRVYHNAMVCELKARNIACESEARLTVGYKGQSVGEYVADLAVDQRLMVELKCVQAFADEHVAQCPNYLRATGLCLALLINFQSAKVEIKRVVFNF